jgi:hypothetical protein
MSDRNPSLPFRGLPAFVIRLSAFCLILAGCATEVANTIPLTQTKYPPKPENSPVEIFTTGIPTRAFERVATIDVRCEAQFFADPTFNEKAVPVFKRKAREAGCDAVIEITEVKTPQNWTLETRTKTFSGTGIVYK